MTAPLTHTNIVKIVKINTQPSPLAGFIDTVKMNNNLEGSFMHYTDVNQKDAYGFTALYWAVSHHNMHNVELLMYFGATLEVTHGTNALFYAIECDNFEALKYFIEKGIDKNITRTSVTGKTYTLLAHAQRLKRKVISEYLK